MNHLHKVLSFPIADRTHIYWILVPEEMVLFSLRKCIAGLLILFTNTSFASDLISRDDGGTLYVIILFVLLFAIFMSGKNEDEHDDDDYY